MSSNDKKHKSYTSEFKEGAIKLALSSASVAQAAKGLGIPEGTLHTWMHKARKSGLVAVSAADGVVNNINVAQVINENSELKKRISRLEQEKAILKKAALGSSSHRNNFL